MKEGIEGLQLLFQEDCTGDHDYTLKLYGKLDAAMSKTMERVVSKHMGALAKELSAEVILAKPESTAWKLGWITKAREIFDAAFRCTVSFKELPNGYCGPLCCPHRVWLEMMTPAGPITVGWRKRVIHLSWEQSTIQRSADDLFPAEPVTKGEKYIHAWLYDALLDYVHVLADEHRRVWSHSP